MTPLRIELSPSGGFRLWTSESTHVDLPNDSRATASIAKILRARQMAVQPPKIGTPGFPTQHAVDLWLREQADRRYHLAMSDMGLSLDDLDLSL